MSFSIAAIEENCNDIKLSYEALKSQVKVSCKGKKGKDKKSCKEPAKDLKKKYKACKKADKQELKKVKCLAKGKVWTEKGNGKFKCIKSSKIMSFEKITINPQVQNNPKKFKKCQKLWGNIKKKIKGNFLKVKHAKKLERKGCILTK